MTVRRDELAGVVLAAGAGTRLRPLTYELPKAMCPVGNRPLVDWAIDRVAPHVSSVAVNAHESQPQLVEHLAGRAHVSVESGERLGTAGALGRLRGWIDGRHVLVQNADSFVDDDLSALVDGWTGEQPRLLVRREPHPSDFGPWRFLGVSLLPARIAGTLPDEPCGLYSWAWKPAYDAGLLETVEARGTS
ncbi:MAG: NDP-sugar synthase, partial [Candidatus Nanopelagicales bacterium]